MTPSRRRQLSTSPAPSALYLVFLPRMLLHLSSHAGEARATSSAGSPAAVPQATSELTSQERLELFYVDEGFCGATLRSEILENINTAGDIDDSYTT